MGFGADSAGRASAIGDSGEAPSGPIFSANEEACPGQIADQQRRIRERADRPESPRRSSVSRKLKSRGAGGAVSWIEPGRPRPSVSSCRSSSSRIARSVSERPESCAGSQMPACQAFENSRVIANRRVVGSAGRLRRSQYPPQGASRTKPINRDQPIQSERPCEEMYPKSARETAPSSPTDVTPSPHGPHAGSEIAQDVRTCAGRFMDDARQDLSGWRSGEDRPHPSRVPSYPTRGDEQVA